MDAGPDLGALEQIQIIAGFERSLGAIVKEINEMSRLREKLATAAGIAKGLEQVIEGRADALISRGGELKVRTNEAFVKHEARLDEAGQGLDELEDALRLLDNGGPPLDASEPTSK